MVARQKIPVLRDPQILVGSMALAAHKAIYCITKVHTHLQVPWWKQPLLLQMYCYGMPLPEQEIPLRNWPFLEG